VLLSTTRPSKKKLVNVFGSGPFGLVSHDYRPCVNQNISATEATMNVPNIQIPPDTTDARRPIFITLEEAAKPVAALLKVRARGYQAYSEHIPSNAAGAFDPVPDISLKPGPANAQTVDLPVAHPTKPASEVIYRRRFGIPPSVLKR
jgi:hypothetical protein